MTPAGTIPPTVAAPRQTSAPETVRITTRASAIAPAVTSLSRSSTTTSVPDGIAARRVSPALRTAAGEIASVNTRGGAGGAGGGDRCSRARVAGGAVDAGDRLARVNVTVAASTRAA